jgi:hypothetical protein
MRNRSKPEAFGRTWQKELANDKTGSQEGY